jgi:hypothetical protein
MVDRGEADAALLSDEELASFKTMTFNGLHQIWSSPAEMPPMSVSVTKRASAADKEAIAKVLSGMCSDPKGVDVCKALDIQKFGPPDKAAYDAALKKLEAK